MTSLPTAATPGVPAGQAVGTAPPESPLMRALAVPAMLGIGALVALQTLINGELAERLGTGTRAGVAAAVLSFGSGFVVLTVAVALLPGPRRGLGRLRRAAVTGTLRPWQLAGGMVGGLLVAAQGLSVQTIGVALFTVAVVAGQTSSGLLVDRAGIGPSGVQAVTPARVLGAALALLAVGLSASGRFGGSDALTAAGLALALLPLLAGCGTAWQQAVNGRVSAVGGPIAAAWNNFLVGLLLLLALLAASLVLPGELRILPGPWWFWVGGVLGVVFISSAAVLVRVHGVLVLGLCTIAGQVIASLVIDSVIGADLGVLGVGGAVLTLLGVLVASLAGRRARRTRAAQPAA